MARKFLSSKKFVVKINKRLLMKELMVKNSKAMANLVKANLKPVVEKSAKKLRSSYEKHPVTREIKRGPLATNTSGTLGGYGNLFSFIGFDSSEDPTSVISEILNKEIKVTARRIGTAGKFKINIFAPTEEDIYQQTPIPWLSQSSWVEGIEKGIRGLGYYLFKSEGTPFSASGTGLQSKNRISGVSFETTPYLHSLLVKFRKDLEK
mgnify:CR=1 FL=1